MHALHGAGFPSKVNILERISSLPPCYHSCVCCTYSVSQCVQLFCNPMDCRFPGSSVHEIFQERILDWVGMSSSRKSFCYPRVKGNKCWMDRFNSAAAAAKSLQSCPTLWPQRRQPTRLPRPWDSPGKNTGVGCHFLLQFVKVKSESEVTQSCPTPSDPMDCSLPGSSVHEIFQAKYWSGVPLPSLKH